MSGIYIVAGFIVVPKWTRNLLTGDCMLEGRIFVRTFKNRICKSENIFKKSKIRISIVLIYHNSKVFFYFVIKNNS